MIVSGYPPSQYSYPDQQQIVYQEDPSNPEKKK
jgi:hypothetical protein